MSSNRLFSREAADRPVWRSDGARREVLIEELRGYAAIDDAEEAHRRAMLALLAAGGDPFTRSAFQPGHFTASCYVIDSDGRLLLHHHRRLDRWLQMGGHVDGSEIPAEAALREGCEESGLADLTRSGGILDLDVHRIPAGKGEPEHDHFDVRYLARTSSPEAASISSGESKDLAWVTLDRAWELMPGLESHRVLRKIERLLGERSLR